MAITTTFGVTVDSVLVRLPGNEGDFVSATSAGLRTGDVEAYIDDGAALYISALSRHGRVVTDLTDDATAQVQVGVRSYALAACLRKMGFSDTQEYREARDHHAELYARYQQSPSSVSGGRRPTLSNVPTADRKFRSDLGLEFKLKRH